MATVVASERVQREELLAASDEVIEDAVKYANPMVLRGLIYQLTGDPELKDMELKWTWAGRTQVVSPATDGDVAMLRRKAAAYLKSYRDSGAGPIDYGPPERLPESLALVVGEEIKPEALGLMIEETALDPWSRALAWQAKPDPKKLDEFSVTIIGAGMGGLNAAVQLKRAGIRHSVIEKNSDVGGTWHQNRYPGARVDSPSRIYTHLFGVDFPYPYAYGPHRENEKYFHWVVDQFGLRDSIAFNTEVSSMTWDEAAAMWEIEIEGPEGKQTLHSNAVITSVGFLNHISMPNIEGMDEFKGLAWHTSQWPADFDHRGKRFAVIGTGCTGYQLAAELAREAGQVTVFQRTPQWLLPTPGYLSPSPDQLLWLDRNLPFHTNFMRFLTFYGGGPDFYKLLDIDPDYDDPHAVSDVNKGYRDRSVAFIESKLDNPELAAAMIPEHPPWSARLVAVDTQYCILDAILRENVSLVTEGIKRINETGIVDNTGKQHDFDVIVYATGFRANDFLFPMKVTGRGGRTLDDLWGVDGPRAYLGCMLPDFPNMWMLYGPNTNGGLPVAQFQEVTIRYALQCMEKLITDDEASIAVKEDAYWRYNRLLDELNAKKVWADPRAQSYWWTKHGRSTCQTPFTGYEVREFLLHPDYNDLELR